MRAIANDDDSLDEQSETDSQEEDNEEITDENDNQEFIEQTEQLGQKSQIATDTDTDTDTYTDTESDTDTESQSNTQSETDSKAQQEEAQMAALENDVKYLMNEFEKSEDKQLRNSIGAPISEERNYLEPDAFSEISSEESVKSFDSAPLFRLTDQFRRLNDEAKQATTLVPSFKNDPNDHSMLKLLVETQASATAKTGAKTNPTYILPVDPYNYYPFFNAYSNVNPFATFYPPPPYMAGTGSRMGLYAPPYPSAPASTSPYPYAPFLFAPFGPYDSAYSASQSVGSNPVTSFPQFYQINEKLGKSKRGNIGTRIHNCISCIYKEEWEQNFQTKNIKQEEQAKKINQNKKFN